MRRAAVLLGVLLTLLAAAPATAAGYRYWSFWEGAGTGGWTYATQGPSQLRPDDGAVVGFRFAVSQDAAAEAAKPRAAADFAAVCGGTAAVEGRKRIALVLDFGVPADAPQGETPPRDTPRTACAQVPPAASAAEALAEVAKPLRYDDAALLCAISGYPARGCGDQVAATAPTAGADDVRAAEPEPSGGPSLGLLAGIAAVAAVAAAATLTARKRRP
ncbi:SCO2322 family protein [Streptomyces antimicrobicus]|uniref:Secreted protein n=1 Tax=Streptomyces antimicrobicus TaxID=2883108 RepID=A0ABS8BG02_9ACTN|nr:SCO2322 family protein [Streptomyces antimicrobicus]MCB5183453.1 hypothetical protein [Streptomyces antimicrobicus]